MTQIEQARRAMFDKWYKSLLWNLCDRCSKDEEIAWKGFNVALDSLVIDLPKRIEGSISSTGALLDAERNTTIDDCRTSIESLNLGIKIT